VKFGLLNRMLMLAALSPVATYAQTAPADNATEKTISIGEAAQNAVKQSQLTLEGSSPFHLKATITNTENPGSDYRATIEESWLSPRKWRRTIESPQFSEVLVVDGDKISETDRGDYYPFWLHDLVTAIFEPLPMEQQLQSFKGAVTLPSDSESSYSCLNFAVPSGVPPAQSNIAYAFCFRGKNGVVQAVVTPGYKAQFEDYQPFKNRRVARRIVEDLAPDVKLEARITALDDNVVADRALFSVEQPTPPGEQLKNQQVGEATARSIAVAAPALTWPPVREGKTSGTVSLYVSVDKLGRVREAWPLASDNPEVTPAARNQVMEWRFQPYVNGGPMQMESILTFAFTAAKGAPIPLLSNSQARKLAAHVVEPHVARGQAARGTFTLRIRVDEHGKLVRVLNPKGAPPELYQAGEKALQQWRFRPYRNDGKPDLFDADITFKVR
jgi:outer membrane biosynthesis protein TonB